MNGGWGGEGESRTCGKRKQGNETSKTCKGELNEPQYNNLNLVKAVQEVCRVNTMPRDIGSIMMDKAEYWKHMEGRRGWFQTKSFKKFGK